MGDMMNSTGSYRVEVSGWGLDDNFFVEKTDLIWSQSGEKKVLLHRTLSEGAILFIRLQGPEFNGSSGPVTYQVAGVQPMDCNGQCEMRLVQMHPRSKESIAGELASYLQEESSDRCEPREDAKLLEHEEILQ